jgi:hypothetical protein
MAGIEGGEDVRNDVSSSGNGLLAGLAVPDSDRVASDGGLAAERAHVSGVLCDFHLLDLLTEGSTVSVREEQSVNAIPTTIPSSSVLCAPIAPMLINMARVVQFEVRRPHPHALCFHLP